MTRLQSQAESSRGGKVARPSLASSCFGVKFRFSISSLVCTGRPKTKTASKPNFWARLDILKILLDLPAIG